MDHVRWLVDPEGVAVTRPVLVAAFTGWNDAGDAASTAVETLIESSGARHIADIDPEHFTDFATIRPHVQLDANRNRLIQWPTVRIWSASLPGTDVILVLGPEPALKWRSFCEQIVAVAQRFEAAMGLTVGALLADVPHTRPTQIIGSATDDALIERFELDRSRYEGPTGIIGVLHDALSRSGLATASLWAAVPGYASQLQSPRAAMALVERACSMMGTPAPVVRLASQVADYDAKVAALIAEDDDLVTYVGRLEEMVDEMSDDDDSFDDDDDDDMSSLDASDPAQLADEVERFLRDHGRES